MTRTLPPASGEHARGDSYGVPASAGWRTGAAPGRGSLVPGRALARQVFTGGGLPGPVGP